LDPRFLYTDPHFFNSWFGVRIRIFKQNLSSFCYFFSYVKTLIFEKIQALGPDPQIFHTLDPDPYQQIFQTLFPGPDPHEMDADPKPCLPGNFKVFDKSDKFCSNVEIYEIFLSPNFNHGHPKHIHQLLDNLYLFSDLTCLWPPRSTSEFMT